MTKSPKVVLKELEDAKKKEGSFLRWGEPQSIGSGRYDISCVFRIAQGNKEIKGKRKSDFALNRLSNVDKI
jgi:hypothetical protein